MEGYGGYTNNPRMWHTWTTTTTGATGPYVYSGDPDAAPITIDVPSMWPHDILDPDVVKRIEKEGPKVSTHEDLHPSGRKYAVTCDDMADLSQERILKTISAMKGTLMLKCSPVKVHNIVCKMTPQAKDNIVKACKRLTMYGKKTPFIARFDEYGRRLPDEVKIETLHGATIQIVDPAKYGPCFLSFEGIVKDFFNHYVSESEDIPF